MLSEAVVTSADRGVFDVSVLRVEVSRHKLSFCLSSAVDFCIRRYRRILCV